MLLGMALVIGVGMAFAFALQVAQMFVPRRDAAWSDVVWNTLGLLGGLLLARPGLLLFARWRLIACRLRCDRPR
jgi:VanZ family protein